MLAQQQPFAVGQIPTNQYDLAKLSIRHAKHRSVWIQTRPPPTIASALLAVEVLAFAFYSAVDPKWLRPIMRSEYEFLWHSANWLTGNDFPVPDRFK